MNQTVDYPTFEKTEIGKRAGMLKIPDGAKRAVGFRISNPNMDGDKKISTLSSPDKNILPLLQHFSGWFDKQKNEYLINTCMVRVAHIYLLGQEQDYTYKLLTKTGTKVTLLFK